MLYLYVVLVAASTTAGCLLTWRMPVTDSVSVGWRWLAMILVMLLVTASVIGAGMIGRDLSSPHEHAVWWALAVTAGAGCVAGLPVMAPALSLLPALAVRVFAFLFTTIVLFHLPKLYVLHDMFLQSGMKYPTAGLFLGLSALAAAMGLLLARGRSRVEQLLLATLLVAIYLVSIRESWVYWGLDAFHEGESFLAVPLMTSGRYGFLTDFFPVHGLGRNILHGYYMALFGDNNLYFSRVVQALTYPFVHVLVAACLYRYARSLLVPLAFFVLAYLFGLLEERDVSPFLLLAFLLVPLADEDGRAGLLLKLGAGLALFLSAIYSIELFIFLNVAMAATLGHWLVSRVWHGSAGRMPWMHIAFYVALLLFFVSQGGGAQAWLDAVLNTLQKSPNLLQRTLEAPQEFSPLFLLISACFALFMLFFVAQVVAFLRSVSHRTASLDMLVAMVAMLSLMFFVRAFNRSDEGHVLYAFAISLPVMLAVAMHYRWISMRTFSLCSLMVLMLFVAQGLATKTLSLDVLRQRPQYDNRLKQADVRPAENFGAIAVPAGIVGDAQMTRDELATLHALVADGYSLFDMTNQPVLVYGALRSPLVTNDIHTLFYNTYGEQQAAIRRLQAKDKVVVLWSANHWSETLDSTYAEYRLPVLSEYVLRTYPVAYRVGKFILFARRPVLGLFSKNIALRTNYDLGFAPSRMMPYKNEIMLMGSGVGGGYVHDFRALNVSAALVSVNATGGGKVFVEMKKHGRLICRVGFNVPRGDSQNFVRLSNLPVYVRENPDSVSVVAGDAGSRIVGMQYMSPDRH